jgi:hypothetical protein
VFSPPPEEDTLERVETPKPIADVRDQPEVITLGTVDAPEPEMA